MNIREGVAVYRDLKGLSTAAAEIFVSDAANRIKTKGFFTAVLSGGSTPAALYTLLATEPFRRRVDFSCVHLFWGDERCVPPDDPQNNFLLARRNLLDKIDIPEENIHRMKGELAPPDAADEYEADILNFFKSRTNGAADTEPFVPAFDLVLLGLGTDGHTLSLFPATPALEETSRLVVENYVPTLDTWRLTMTLPLLNRASKAVFLVSGAQKAGMLRDVLVSMASGGDLPAPYPAAMVRPVSGRAVWLVDAAAASLL